MESKKWFDIGGSIVMIAIFLGGFYIYATIVNGGHKTTEPQPPLKPLLLQAPNCLPTFDDYETLANKQSVDLTQNFHAYAANGSFAQPPQQVTLVRSGRGSIACGYLYVKATKDDTSVDKIDHIYINPAGFGGHIVATNSIALGSTPATDTIEFLLPLNAITYLPDDQPYNLNDASNYRIADWVSLLNVSNQTTFEINSAIQNSAAVIDDVKIAYKCWNPNDTKNYGQETSDCTLGTQ